MNQTLNQLSSHLSEDQIIYKKEYFTDNSQFVLMKKKGVFPYDYMDSTNKFNETLLPKREDFLQRIN